MKHKEQLRILMFMDVLKKRFHSWSGSCTRFRAYVHRILRPGFHYSLGMLENMIRFKQVSAALEINVMYAYLIIPISMALTIFRTLQGLYRDIRNNTLEFESRED